MTTTHHHHRSHHRLDTCTYHHRRSSRGVQLPGGICLGLALALLLGLIAVVGWPAVALAQEEGDASVNTQSLGELLELGKVATSVIIIVVAYVLSGLTSAGFDNLGERLASRRLLLKKVSSLTRFGIYISAATIIVVGVLKPDQQTLITLSATLAVAVGLALKDLTSSIIAGVIILLDSPFQVGDRVQFGGTYGEVVEIGLRTVKINTSVKNLLLGIDTKLSSNVLIFT
ncbi:MAG: mechanosensitive ion channel domain-containing protein, partial [Myxococcota bacterium]